SGELDDVGALRLVSHRPGSLTDQVEERLNAGDRGRITSGYDRKLRCRRELRATEYSRRDVLETMLAVTRGEIAGKVDRDRRHVDVHQPLRRIVEQRIDDSANRCIVGEHREHGVAAERVTRGCNRCCTVSGQGIDARPRAIPYANL